MLLEQETHVIRNEEALGTPVVCRIDHVVVTIEF
jgi:hypothetical protein